MITFSIAAVLLSALAAVLILQRASGAARQTEADPTLVVYRRQLSELDDLAERGLLAEDELKSARTEAARRLLGAAKTAEAPAAAAQPRVSRPLRLAVLAGAVAAPVLAAALYVALGKPGLPDQPFAARVKAWTEADLRSLPPAEVAAVLQQAIAKDPNKSAKPLTLLADMQLQSGNVAAAEASMRKAIRLQPDDSDLWASLGILLLAEGQGEETQPAQQAFRQALKLDPTSAPARYHLARAQIAAGDVNGGLNVWRALAAELPAEAPERPELEQQIAAVAKAGRLVAPPKTQGAPPQQQAEAGSGPEALAGALTGQAPAGGPQGSAGQGGPDPRQMVAQLAARLEQNPNDLAGWARLIRSYAVLGDPDKMKQAQDRARQIFKGQPEALKTLDNAAAAPQGSE
jgi:cytochrome c-type biogenesis protein CcmH